LTQDVETALASFLFADEPLREATIATTPKKPAKKTAVKKPALKTVKSPPAAKATPAKKAAPAAAATAKAKSAALAKATALHEMIVKALDQDKGDNIVSIELAGKSALADFMVIVTGTSSRHVTGMSEKLKQRLSKEGIIARIEGASTGDWVIVDAGDVIVHLFRAEVRTFYNLEKLWASDFATIDYTLYKSV
jgi:ribosome-associated protein